MIAIPASWKQTELGEILLSIVGGGTPSKSNPSYYQGNIPWMSVKDMNKNILNDTVDHISEEAVENSSTNVIPPGTPIIATRMSLGKIVVANFDTAINQDLKALFPATGVERNYLIYWYRSISSKIEELGTGTTVKGIRLEVLKSLEFPMVPLAEQKVIADKLDKLIAQVETTKARLDRIPQILKTFRQSVLSAAVSGKLTEEWRGESLTIADIADFQNGYAFKSDWFETNGEYQVIKLGNIRDGYLAIENAAAYLKRDIAEDYIRFTPNRGDTLISMTGTRFKQDYGFGCLVGDETNLLVNQRVGRLIPDRSVVLPEFLNVFVRSELFRGQFFKGETGGVNQGNVGSKHIMSINVELPTLEEQTQIVRRVEELFAFADNIEQKANAALERVNKLTQSILAKAFRGELTAEWRAQNPELISGDNSAEALLTKIKAEREAMKPSKKTSKKKT
ncbi:restriction endonuclease subunit S [Catenovulum sp. 2E275]|nr:restriction endonuclease subunit S [Catenovulum sp. 2E275]MCU4675248.1 restriction endonuclease subunit S [Catenovulum sp. 2E275]